MCNTSDCSHLAAMRYIWYYTMLSLIHHRVSIPSEAGYKSPPLPGSYDDKEGGGGGQIEDVG